MTAKESFESLLFNYAPVDDREFRGHLLRFAAQLCKEQRDSCCVDYYIGETEDVEKSVLNIRNAPMPEL